MTLTASSGVALAINSDAAKTLESVISASCVPNRLADCVKEAQDLVIQAEGATDGTELQPRSPITAVLVGVFAALLALNRWHSPRPTKQGELYQLKDQPFLDNVASSKIQNADIVIIEGGNEPLTMSNGYILAPVSTSAPSPVGGLQDFSFSKQGDQVVIQIPISMQLALKHSGAIPSICSEAAASSTAPEALQMDCVDALATDVAKGFAPGGRYVSLLDSIWRWTQLDRETNIFLPLAKKFDANNNNFPHFPPFSNDILWQINMTHLNTIVMSIAWALYNYLRKNANPVPTLKDVPRVLVILGSDLLDPRPTSSSHPLDIAVSPAVPLSVGTVYGQVSQNSKRFFTLLFHRTPADTPDSDLEWAVSVGRQPASISSNNVKSENFEIPTQPGSSFLVHWNRYQDINTLGFIHTAENGQRSYWDENHNKGNKFSCTNTVWGWNGNDPSTKITECLLRPLPSADDDQFMLQVHEQILNPPPALPHKKPGPVTAKLTYSLFTATNGELLSTGSFGAEKRYEVTKAEPMPGQLKVSHFNPTNEKKALVVLAHTDAKGVNIQWTNVNARKDSGNSRVWCDQAIWTDIDRNQRSAGGKERTFYCFWPGTHKKY